MSPSGVSRIMRWTDAAMIPVLLFAVILTAPLWLLWLAWKARRFKREAGKHA